MAQRSGTLFGYPSDLLRSRNVDNSWVLIFNAGMEDEGVCAVSRARPSLAPAHVLRALRAAAVSLSTVCGGRYTLQGRETPAKCHGTYVLAFERHEEASRFAMLLQARRCGV